MNLSSAMSTASLLMGNNPISTRPVPSASDRILPLEVVRQLQGSVSAGGPSHTSVSFDGQNVLETETRGRERQVEILRPAVPVERAMAQPSFVTLQEWEGIVTVVSSNAFTARLVNVTADTPDEETEFSFAELNDDDLELVAPGAIFRWSAGVLTMPGGGKLTTSQVVFRRLPKWTKRDLQRADQIAQRLIQRLAPSAARNENRSA